MRVVEGALLVWVLAIAALRATFTETPHMEGMWRTHALSHEAISLLLSLSLPAALVVWVLAGALTGRLRWKKTYFTAAAGIFCAIGIAGVWAASDKRAAITDLTVMLSGPAAGLLAVQLFDRKEKVRLFLWLLLAVAAAAAYACYDKMTFSGEQLIAEYEKNPEPFLAVFGIEAGSLEHWQYEHRLYSKDVSGFLTTSNSAGSFFLLAVFAGLGLCLEAFGARRGSEETLAALVCTALATAIALAGLLMTQSKGAIGAFLLLLLVLAACLIFHKLLWAYRRAVGVILAAGAVVAIAVWVMYGLRHGRLPGGNSMLVRWQYWTASAQMAKDMPLLGTGGGNFATQYLKYKAPAAPETISDPHNWVFSLMCRFGVIGLVTMGLAMVRPVGRMFAYGVRGQPLDSGQENAAYADHFLWTAVLAGVLAALVVVRPTAMHLGMDGPSPHERLAAFLLLILIPAGIVALVFGVLRFSGTGDASFGGPNVRLTAALACGLGAVLLHNLVDFALFEPGVWTVFWLTTAAGVALTEDPHNEQGEHRIAALRTRWQRAVAAIGPAVVVAAVVWVAVAPPLRRGKWVYQAMHTADTLQARRFLDQAVAVDTLSPNAAATGARLMKQQSEQQIIAQGMDLLDTAQAFAETAIGRSPKDPRLLRLLADILLEKAQRSKQPSEKQALREAAYTALQEALKRYPGSDMLHYRLGVLAEERGDNTAAIAHLQRAMEIETAYRAQFRGMYPRQEEVVSRLGPHVYADVLERLKRLQHQ